MISNWDGARGVWSTVSTIFTLYTDWTFPDTWAVSLSPTGYLDYPICQTIKRDLLSLLWMVNIDPCHDPYHNLVKKKPHTCVNLAMSFPCLKSFPWLCFKDKKIPVVDGISKSLLDLNLVCPSKIWSSGLSFISLKELFLLPRLCRTFAFTSPCLEFTPAPILHFVFSILLLNNTPYCWINKI